MTHIVFLGISILVGLAVFGLIYRKYGSDCIP